MIDIHTHILHDLDDGSSSLEESIEIIEQAVKNNITDIVLTPHYIKNSKYNANNKEKQNKLNQLKEELTKRNININLYLGNEIFIEQDIISLSKEISTINNSRYILIELPLASKYIFLEETLEEIHKKGLIPIIAHPERYLAYYCDYEFFINLKEKGCLFQGNLGSLFNYYGRKSRKMLKKMLKLNLIDFIASDIHKPYSDIYKKDIEKKLFRITKDKEKINNLLINNPYKVINNLNIK